MMSHANTDISSQECLLSWTAHPNSQVYCAQFSTDETSVYTMGNVGTVWRRLVMCHWVSGKGGGGRHSYNLING